MGLVWTCLLNGMLGLGGYWAARHGFRQPSGPTRGLAAAALAWAWATVGMEVLGAAGWLGLVPLFLWAASGLAIGLVLRVSDWADPRVGPAAAREAGPWSWEAVVALGLLVWVALVYGAQSLVMPVLVVSDGPIYHLYFAARWWKEGRLSLIAAPFGETAATYFPAVGDLWFTWLMTSWGGDRLARAGQLPFWAASAVAAYALARRLGAGRSSALIATSWFATSSPLLLFASQPNVDMIFVAGYLVAALFFFRYALGEARWGTLAIGAIAAGGALGTKAIGIVFVPPLLGLALVFVVARRASRRETLGHILIVLALPAVLAGFWYARNAWLTGNPLYPLHLEVGGRVWLAGWYGPEAMRLSTYYIPRGEWRAFSDIVLSVLDPRLAPFWLAAVAGCWAVGMPRSPESRAVWGCAALAVLNVALYWLVIPYRTQQRFMFHGVGLAVVPLARLLARGRWLRAAAVGLLGLHLVTWPSWPFPKGRAPWDLFPFIDKSRAGLMFDPESASLAGEAVPAALALGSLAVAWMWGRLGTPPARRRVLRAGIASLGLVGVALAVYFPRQLDPRSRFYPFFPDFYAGWLELETRVGPSGARIAYAGTNLPYYLLGSGLRNQVRYVNVDAHRGWLMHDYHREAQAQGRPTWPGPRPGWDRIHPDYDDWLANLRAEQIQVLVVTRANPAEGEYNIADAQEFPIERRWADAHPETFVPLYGAGRFRIYGLRRTITSR